MSVASTRHKALVICPQRQMMSEVIPLLATTVPLVPVRKLNHFPDKKDLADALTGYDAKLCFLDFSSGGAGGFQTLEIVQSSAPHLAVVALLTANNPDLVLNCLRAGAAAFVVHPFTADQIEGAVEAALRRLPAGAEEAPHARLVGVVPAKGGAGASTLACNLAWQFKRQGAERVLLCDVDPLTGTLSFVLKLKSNYSFLDVVQRADTLDEDLWKQMVTRVSGVDVLLASERVVDTSSELSAPDALAEFAGPMYNAIILDTAGPFGTWNTSIARMCDDLLLVCSNELASVHAAGRALTYLETHDVGRDRIRVVVSRYEKEAGLHTDRIAEALGVPVAHVIPADADAVAKSLMDGKPISPSSAFGKSLATLAGKLLETENKPSKSARSGKKNRPGLLSSLFSRS